MRRRMVHLVDFVIVEGGLIIGRNALVATELSDVVFIVQKIRRVRVRVNIRDIGEHFRLEQLANEILRLICRLACIL
jgi:hypothetical protein